MLMVCCLVGIDGLVAANNLKGAVFYMSGVKHFRPLNKFGSGLFL
jgi:hypothetical protein